MSAATVTAPSSTETKPKAEFFQFTNLGPVLFGLLVSGGVALLACLLIALFGGHETRERLLFSWLFAFTVCFTLTVGSLFWVLVHHAVDAEWSVVVRRVLETMATTFFYLGLFILPILLFAPGIYEWMRPGFHDPTVEAKHLLLNRTSWGIRTVVYLVFFFVLTRMLRYFSTRQDETGDPSWTVKLRITTYPMIPLFAICLTGAVVDWLMAINPHWYSTMWGVYLFAGAAWSSMALLIVIVYRLQKAGYLQGIVTVEHYHIMGKLLLSFTVFWAYIAFDQYFLYWYGNIPEEVEYYIRRNTENWNILSTALVALHFFLPFLLLLPRVTKRTPSYLARIAMFVLLIQMLDIYIIVIAAAPSEERGATLLTFLLSALSLVAIAAPLALLFLRNLGRHALYPLRDPRIVKSLKLVN